MEELADAIYEHLSAAQPTALLPARVPLAEALAPAWSDSFERFVAAYMHVVGRVGEHGEHGQDGQGMKAATQRGAPAARSTRGPHRQSDLSGAPEGHTGCATTPAAWHVRLRCACASAMDPCEGCVDPCEGESAEAPREGAVDPCEGCDFETGEAIEAPRSFDLLEDLRRHYQRKLAGHARSMILIAQDFIAHYCMEDERGFFTKEAKLWMTRMNDAMRPWVRLLGEITSHKRLSKLAPMIVEQVNGPVVYARVNLENDDMYIGETVDFHGRTIQHYVATCRHRSDASRPCKGCKEHVKYKKHRSVVPSAWITVPIVMAKEKYDAKRAERKLIREMKPCLNAPDKPFWLLKDNYATVYKSTRRRKMGAKPWRRDSTITATSETMPFFTTYWFGAPGLAKHLHLDFGAVLSMLEKTGAAGIVTVQPGRHDVTRWARVRARYGGSKIRTFGADPFDGILHDWRKSTGDAVDVHVRAHVQKTVEDKVWKDIDDFANAVESASEDGLAFYWRIRRNRLLFPKFRAATMILSECEQRYDGFSRKRIEIRLPFFKRLDAGKMRAVISSALDARPWPKYLIDWHKTNLRIITESQPSIESIMCNVTKPWMPREGCSCAEIKARLQKKDASVSLPEIDGHLFFISRDYAGPNARALSVGGNNIPNQTMWDMSRAWEMVGRDLPVGLGITSDEWKSSLKRCVFTPKWCERSFVSTKEVYTLRKDLKGLVCGQLDKNLHELWFACPCLYRKAWDKMYGEQTGYAKVYPRKLTRQARTLDSVLETTPPQARSAGGERDLVKSWELLYKRKQWHRYASFDKKGGTNLPYILFKAKHVVDHEVRKTKWHKARPIAPQTKHPMKRLFHLTGRAWSFITGNLTR